MRASLFLPLIFLAAVSCDHSSLLSPLSLDGTWEWQFNRNPSGSSMTLSLAAVGSKVIGSGGICGVGPACTPGSVTVTGQASGMSFQFTIQSDSGYVATYSGQLIGRDQLSGTWTQGGRSNTVIFYRS